ncbi:Yip1 family protein [Shewanella zhangzhouensis]|uniref:Yip1 family protein n=1 Tax=Shewanella zhangzhouensis TaxID=2864213 RepID=UPI001C658D8D|nr:Yip1 family protein [Shewanella zhangzhouensis]QYK05833.1 YIP1 family protein [Shewanella zhangzhouensis]
MKIFDILTSNQLLKETDAYHEISSSMTQSKYHQHIERKGKNIVIDAERENRAVLRKRVGDHKKLAKGSTISTKITQVRHLEHELLPNTEQKIKEIEYDLKAEFEKKKLQDTELAKFKEINNLKREARYPEDQRKIWGWIVFGLLFESILNAFFLAKASEFGLAGGFAMAVAISLINIVIAFFFANGFRSAHHIESKRSMLGILGMILVLLVMFTVALFIGHYRAALDQEAESAAFEAVKAMWEQPFGISTFDSWMLFLVTVTIFSVVVYKFCTNDDSYPEYGDITRKTLETRRVFSSMRTKAAEMIRREKELLNRKLEETYQELVNLSHELDEDIEAIAQLESDYRTYLLQQRNEFETFCEECRKRFAAECKAILEEQAVLPEKFLELEIPELETLLEEQDKHRFAEVSSQLRAFMEVEFSLLRKEFQAKVHLLYAEKEAA